MSDRRILRMIALTLFREHYSFNSFPLDSKEVVRFARLTLHSGRRGWGEESVTLLSLADSVLNTALTSHLFPHATCRE